MNDIFAGVRAPDVDEQQASVDTLMQEMRTLDLTDSTAVVNWFDKLVEPSGTSGVRFDADEVCRRLRAAGYKIVDTRPVGFRATSEKIIGNGVECLEQMGFLHQMLGSQIARWRELYSDQPGVALPSQPE